MGRPATPLPVAPPTIVLRPYDVRTMNSPDEALSLIIAELRRREMHPIQSSPLPHSDSVALSLWASEAQRFLNELVPGPLDRDDDLARHIVGRSADLVMGEEPWVFEAYPGLEDDRLVGMGVGMGAGVFRLRVTIGLPTDDLPEVLRRLGIK